MDAGTVLAIAIPVLVVLALAAFVATSRRRDGQAVADLTRETRRADRSLVEQTDEADTGAGPEEEARERYATQPAGAVAAPARAPRDPDEVGMTRRQLFNRGILLSGVVAGGGLGAGILAFMWPSTSAGFGSKIFAGKASEIRDSIAASKQPFYVPEARSYVQAYPENAVSSAKDVYDDRVVAGMESGFVVLAQKCPHLGCRVPWCQSSQWFECPCHGSKYNRVGEKRGGPAPRGMDRFVVEIDGDRLSIDTGTFIVGPEVGTNTTGQEPEGPHCV
jgi:cytochrome b6-f complex iron-sulfur subunit